MPFRPRIVKFSVVFSAALFFCGSASAAVRLGVVVVVDQMRPEYLDRSDLPNGGFRRLREGGARFMNARHLHIPTETGPGHAAISTGRTPSVHGIVANDWYDRAAGAETYCFADSVYGLGPQHMMGPTLADWLKAADPKARVFSVSGKDRAAIALGGRKADAVLWFDKKTGEFTTSPYYRRPAWLAAFNAELRKKALLPVRAGRVSADLIASPSFDSALDLLVAELVARERLGRGPGTDLLLIGYSATDYVGHRYGVEAKEMDAQLTELDRILGLLLARAEKASGGSLALALSADHGAIPAVAGARRLDGKEFVVALEKTLQEKWPTAGRNWILSAQAPHLYLDRVLAGSTGLSWPDFKRAAARELSGLDGVARVLSDDEASSLPASDPLAATFRRSLYASRSGDLQLIVAENAFIHDQNTGTSHGSPWDNDARVPLLFWGRGVKAGRVEAPAAVQDLAPTLGRLLGLDYPPGEGASVRAEALEAAR